MGHLFHVGDKDTVTDDKPIADGGVALGNHINPIVFSVVMKTDFNDPAIRCVTICDGENSFVQELQAEHVVDPAENRFRKSFFLEPFQVDVRECFLQETVHEKDKTFTVRKKTESNFLVLARKENLPVFRGWRSENVLIRRAIEGPLRLQRLVDVVEPLAVRRKGKSPQVPAREEIGEALPSLNFKQLKSPRSLSPF